MVSKRVVTDRSQEPRRRFREELRRLRTERGDSLRKLGDALGWDWSLFGKMENGQTLGSADVVQALDHYYGTPGFLLALWELALGDTSQFKEQFRNFMALERQATSIHLYAPSILPGLLQTREYARTLFELSGTFDVEEEIDEQVDARLSRRDVLVGEEAPDFRAILDEAVLRRPLLDAGTWRQQLEHIAEAASQRNVVVQVLPFSAGLRELHSTETWFLRLPEGRTVAWVETAYTGELVQESTGVELLHRGYDRLRDHALSPRASMEFVQRMLEEAPCP
ncbi:DUF5753 domain-containing protein [Streptomyces coeruleoprunus]|uniref:DUF5753 domain-containing protein n=1 Tax=Streptomyces coeruleoprunus TaxID=285563 RepID=A0ABV9XK26_9ACTN